MMSTRSATRYAKAVLELAVSNGNAYIVNADMKLISNTIESHSELNIFLQSPNITTAVKETILLEVFANTSKLTKDLFKLLQCNKRYEILVAIATKYHDMYQEMNNVVIAKVITAMPLEEKLESMVMEKLKTFSSKKINLINEIDPSIIGGFIIRLGDKQYNASIASKLQLLKRELSN